MFYHFVITRVAGQSETKSFLGSPANRRQRDYLFG